VPVRRQLKLAQAIPGASVHEIEADHAVCVTAPQVFTPVLLRACWSVDAASAATRRPLAAGTAEPA
jgi:3-oxoadipate enol-lactonase